MPPNQDHSLPLESLLPLRSLVVTLQFVQSATPQFFHQAALTAFLRFLAASPDDYDQLIRVDAPESGRIDYQPGDHYRFQIIALAGSDKLLDILIQQLQKLPAASPKTAAELPFRNNCKLHSLQDGFSEESIHSVDELSQYDMPQLQQEIALWDGQTRINWQWFTPARLLKDKQQRLNSADGAKSKPLKGEQRFIRDADDLNGQLLMARLASSIADLLRRKGKKTPPVIAPDNIHIENQHLFWMDSHYTSADKKTQQMGGVSGIIRLSLPANLSPAWWQLLLLGQYTGIGQRTAFGWGRYQLQTAQQHVSYRRVLPASSFLMLAQRPENLEKAWRHVMAGHDDYLQYNDYDDDSDHISWTDDDDDPPEAPIQRLQKDLDKLLFGKYRVPALRGYLIPKKNGGVRPLAIPPIYDRVLQRSITQVLSPALEQLMYRHSHGFRPGRSRITASYDIQAAWRAGYRWVYESDIKNFFDSVNLERLQERLNAIYHGDPLVQSIINWMRADVIFDAQHIKRHNGLPQGSPLSLLMANLMLDDFDSDMQTAGFHLIRFADDFIILCKDPEEAKRAEHAALKSLQEHGLELHPEKTRISAIKEGFQYLGYLFVNDLALDMSAAKADSKTQQHASLPENSWLASLAEQQPQRLNRKENLQQLIDKLANKQPIHIAERDNSGTLIAVTGEHSVISTLNRQMQIHRKDKRIHRLPWKSIQSLVLFGNHQITTQAMHAALQNDVSIHLASGSGRYHGMLSHNRNNQHQRLWLQQTITLQDPEKALYCAREIVASRLRHMIIHLQQRQRGTHLTQINNALKHIHKVTDLQSLRGYEGNATREYYQHLGQIIPPEFEFGGRNRRPPKDPFNVLLSIGYTMLYAMTESFLHASGLLPWQGFYHQPRGKHAVLASDMMEPFRHLIERSALSQIRRHEISIQDFSYNATGGCIIDNTARRKYLALLLQRWETKIRAKGQTEAQTWLTHLQKQNHSLKQFILYGEPFKPFRLR